MIFGSDGIVNDGLIFYLDAGIKSSYSGAGSTWNDLIGSNDLILNNSPTFSSARGGDFFFDGVDDSASRFNITGLPSGSSPRTIELWTTPCSNEYRGFYAGKQTINGTEIYINLTTSIFGVDVFGHYYGRNNLTLNSNLFYCCHVVYPSGQTSSDQLLFYLNGVQQTGNITIAGVPVTVNTAATQDLLLARNANTASFGQCKYGGIKIYNRALSSAEINQNFQVERKRFGA